MVLGVDAESPDIMFDHDLEKYHTLPNFKRSNIPQQFWNELSKIDDFVKRMGIAKTLRVASDVIDEEVFPFECNTALIKWENIKNSLTQTALHENQYLLKQMIMKDTKKTEELFVHPDFYGDADYCFRTLIRDPENKAIVWCIIAIPERLHKGDKTIPSGIFKYHGDDLPEPWEPCKVLSRFQNTAAVTLRNVESQLTHTFGTTPFQENSKTLWIGGGGGNDVVSSCLVASDGDIVMNSIGIRQFVNTGMKEGHRSNKFFEAFYDLVPKNTYVINISEIVCKTMSSQPYVKDETLDDTGTITFEVEMAIRYPKLTVMVCILPFVDVDWRKIEKKFERSATRMKKLFPDLFDKDGFLETEKDGKSSSSVYTKKNWERLMKSQAEHVSNVVVVDTGGDIVTGGNDIREEGADTVWIPLLQQMSKENADLEASFEETASD